jgi:hypothetical protein
MEVLWFGAMVPWRPLRRNEDGQTFQGNGCRLETSNFPQRSEDFCQRNFRCLDYGPAEQRSKAIELVGRFPPRGIKIDAGGRVTISSCSHIAWLYYCISTQQRTAGGWVLRVLW